MCYVSVVTNYGQNIPQAQWTTDTFSQFKEIIARLEKLDVAQDQPDCHDPAKAAWMREVEARLKTLEIKPKTTVQVKATANQQNKDLSNQISNALRNTLGG